jgi:tRNA modification GTPase
VLVGRPNAGKSSLFNALAGTPAALTSPVPGTTRDYLVQTLRMADVAIDLVDTAGRRVQSGAIEIQAQELSAGQTARADLVVLCREAGTIADREETDLLGGHNLADVLLVNTKCDLAEPTTDAHPTSSVTGAGINELRVELARRARAQLQPALAPSLSRCTHHIDACLAYLRHAHATVLDEEPLEILALELRGALDELGEMVGAVYTDDLLDRIFSRFCIGK